MKHIIDLCKPRDSIFADTTREDVLNLSDLVEGRVDGEKFFSENFKTKGMETLFDVAFKRFKGESQTGVIKLTQAMGGGKTHNMLALALIAKDPALRSVLREPVERRRLRDPRVLPAPVQQHAHDQSFPGKQRGRTVIVDRDFPVQPPDPPQQILQTAFRHGRKDHPEGKAQQRAGPGPDQDGGYRHGDGKQRGVQKAQVQNIL